MSASRRIRALYRIAKLLAAAVLAAAAVLVAPQPAASTDRPAAEARARMVAQVVVAMDAIADSIGLEKLDGRLLEAMRAVPRHRFVARELRPYAYAQTPLPLGHGQNLASPMIVALMTQLAEVDEDDVVFETGTGTGYHAAVLARLAHKVVSVEVVPELARRAAQNFRMLDVGNVVARKGDGYHGWRKHAPYDAIILKEAVDHVPPPLFQQLKPGGRMVLPLGKGPGQQLTVVSKTPEGTERRRTVMPVRFTPLQGGERI